MFTGCYFNPRSPHGERPKHSRALFAYMRISTHAPRTGSDGRKARKAAFRQNISTHAPRTGSDIYDVQQETITFTFQPTLPARGATDAI